MLSLVLVLACALHSTCSLVLDDTGTLQAQFDAERKARVQLQAQVLELDSKMKLFEQSITNECTVQCPAKELTSISFMASLSKDLANPAKGHVVVFDDVITNEGNAYNNLHGIFTAPVNGSYNFNVIASSPPSTTTHQMHLIIKKNGTEVGYVFLDQNSQYWLRRSTDVTIHLVVGDQVWVEVDYVLEAHTLAGCCFHTHFSGFRISGD